MRSPRSWPNVTSVVAGYLNGVLDVPVYWDVPSPRPTAFVVVRRNGTAAPSDWIDAAALDFECWHGEPGANPRGAHELGSVLRETLAQMPAHVENVVQVDVLGLSWLPDATSGCPRVLLGADVWVKPAGV